MPCNSESKLLTKAKLLFVGLVFIVTLPCAYSTVNFRISYACFDHCRPTGEQVVPQPVFNYQLAGQTTVSNSD